MTKWEVGGRVVDILKRPQLSRRGVAQSVLYDRIASAQNDGPRPVGRGR